VTNHPGIGDHNPESEYPGTGFAAIGREQARTCRRGRERSCYRSKFTQEQFEQYQNAFWMLPASWGQPGAVSFVAGLAAKATTALAEVRCLGGSGLVSMLPILGWMSGLDATAHEWALSVEELSRLINIDPSTINGVRRALESHGLIETTVKQRHGHRLVHWKMDRVFSARPAVAHHEADPYFYFDHGIVYGGQWAMMRPVERAVYIGVATRARVHADAPEDDYLVREVLRRDVSCDDLHRCRELSPTPGVIRLACVSYSQIAGVTGYSETAVKRAVRSFKHPRDWPESVCDTRALEFAAIRVYPVRTGGALLYHFRDHVEHWPWDVLNGR
jgi:hypothetical protein